LGKRGDKDSKKAARKLNPLDEDLKEECVQKISVLHPMSSEPLA
jgi:hypothetical protein